MVAVRLGLYLSLMLLVGLAAFPLYALRAGERAESRMLSLHRPLLLWCGVAVVLSALGLLMLIAAMMGTSILAVDRETTLAILLATPVGTAWLVRMAALAAALLALLLLKRTVILRFASVLVTGGIALATLVWTGHAGATEGTAGSLHKISDILHMLASAIWLGGIAAFLMLLRNAAGDDGGLRLVVGHRALDDFARVGAISVAVIVVTGLINGQILVGLSNVPALWTNTYGRLLLFKLGLVAIMLLLAAKNRWRLTPALGNALPGGNTQQAVAALRYSLLLEAAAALAILALVAWLGMLEPPAGVAMS